MGRIVSLSCRSSPSPVSDSTSPSEDGELPLAAEAGADDVDEASPGNGSGRRGSARAPRPIGESEEWPCAPCRRREDISRRCLKAKK